MVKDICLIRTIWCESNSGAQNSKISRAGLMKEDVQKKFPHETEK
jgi:hypothetical protein